jgi:hypothetical protein
MAIEAADATRKAIAGLALAAFAAILLGGIAAAIGGAVGTPTPDAALAEVEASAILSLFL